MQNLSKESIAQDHHPDMLGPNWELFLSASAEQYGPHELDEIHISLQEAKLAMRAQEERIRLLERMVLTDELTGLSNRRGFTLAFERELMLARRDSNYGGILVMIDLDGFKTINDKWGHQAGDAYLCAVAEVLRESVRSSDFVARLGGDEFALLLTHMEEKDGSQRIEKLELAFHKHKMIFLDHMPLRASFGFAPYTGTDPAKQVMHIADMRLYAHKARDQLLKVAKA